MLEGVPSSVNYDELSREVAALEGVHTIHALRVWSMDNIHHVAEIELSTSYNSLAEAEQLKAHLRTLFATHNIVQSTIEVSPVN